MMSHCWVELIVHLLIHVTCVLSIIPTGVPRQTIVDTFPTPTTDDGINRRPTRDVVNPAVTSPQAALTLQAPLRRPPYCEHTATSTSSAALSDDVMSCRPTRRGRTSQRYRLRPVCGSDGQTYWSKCQLKHVKLCLHQRVTVVSKGRCPPGTAQQQQSTGRCILERRAAISDQTMTSLSNWSGSSASSASHLYVPECHPDGSYVDEQCHNATGYCWCVTSDGKPIPGSSVHGHKPDCSGYKLLGDQQVLASRTTVRVGKRRRGVVTKDCSLSDRTTFNTNLVRLFTEEYQRQPGSRQLSATATDDQLVPMSYKSTTSGSLVAILDSSATVSTSAPRHLVVASVGRKFNELDRDHDGQLDQKELKTLRYLVNKLVKPRPCARSFHSRCDVNNDRRLSRDEWMECFSNQQHATVDNGELLRPGGGRQSTAATNRRLGPTTSRRRQSFHPSQLRPSVGGDSSGKARGAGGGTSGGTATEKQRTGSSLPTGRQTSTEAHAQSTFLALINSKVIRVSNRTGKHQFVARLTDNAGRGERTVLSGQQATTAETSSGSSGRSSCDEERSHAREMDRVDPESHIFIPDCEPNGLHFKRVQCHNATGYCWCVDQMTGSPIPGISTHNMTPDCSDVNTKRLKGCPPASKKRFLTELLDNMTQEMVDRANNGSLHSKLDEPDPNQSIEERAVRWKLRTLDVNNNNVLERRELRVFRADMRALKGEEKYARKCRRNFLKYCDDDNDKRITMDEWISCTGLNEQMKTLPETHKRRGPNPFSTVLKS